MASNYEYDITISYQWDHQEIVKRIKESLAQAGFRVWIDIEQIYGNKNDIISQAILQSQCILICMSIKYSKSKICKNVKGYNFIKKFLKFIRTKPFKKQNLLKERIKKSKL
jgi:hypothetical protein